MSTQDDREALPRGTLDLLILRTLERGREHGQGIARAIQSTSKDVLLVEHGSLYPALQRLERRGSIVAEWDTSKNNRRARFYELTAKGRRQLDAETDRWQRVTSAVSAVLGLDTARG